MTSRGNKPANDSSSRKAIRSESSCVEVTPGREPFERWLDNKLKNVYGSVLAEPIPDDLINLLRDKLDQK